MQINHPDRWITQSQDMFFQQVFLAKTYEQTGEHLRLDTPRCGLSAKEHITSSVHHSPVNWYFLLQKTKASLT